MKVTAFFTDIKDEIISNLLKANSEIKVAVAWLTDEDIIRTLTQKQESGVNVHIVMSNSKENFRNTRKFKDFIKNQGKLFISTENFLHNKFCIIDNATIINGSYNWTYNARNNEENIMVVTLDQNIKEDQSLITKFTSKYKFFCNKISTQIDDFSTLKKFKEEGKEASILLAQMDEAEIKLRQELEDHVKTSFDEALAINIPLSPHLLERMKLDGGGVEFMKRILHDEISSGEMKSGFRKLEVPIPHRVDLSLEYIVSRPKYEKLFTNKEVEFCKKLMMKYKL